MILAMPLAARQLLQAKSQLKANLLVHAWRRARAVVRLVVARARPRRRVPRLVALPSRQGLISATAGARGQQESDSLILPALSRRYSQGQRSYGFAQDAPAAQKCN